jgi:two-component system phosphate regulon sensor histidine kinase PhoR
MRARSIRGRLTTSYILLVSICLILAAIYVTWRLQAQYMYTYRSMVLTQSRLIGGMLNTYAKEGKTDPAALEQVAQEFRWRPDATIRVVGIPAIGSQGTAASPELREAALGKSYSSVPEAVAALVRVRERLVFAATPVAVDAKPFAVLHVSVPTTWVWVQLRGMLPQLGFALALGLLVALVLGARLARSLTEPIDELTHVASQMSDGDLNIAVTPRGPDEIGRLGEMFNRMADRLRATITTLSAEQTKLAAIVAGMVDGVVATDRTGKIVLANRAATDLLGWPNTGSRSIPPAAPGARLRAILDEAARAGRIAAEELPPAETGDRLIEVHCAPIRGDGGPPIGAVAVLHDLTDLRRLERLRRELTANVSHELRTPLTSIKGFVETLLGGAMSDQDTCRRFLKIIDKETNRLVKLVDDLLDLSRLESQRISLELSRVDMADLVQETITQLRPLAGNRDLQLQPIGGDVTVLADRDRLSQVLMNLLDNAIKFTPENGRIAIGWRPVNGEVEVTVADTGPGISAADLPHVFERFYKADRARPAVPGGSGLGLAIAKHIVEAHGGRIRVASTPGSGTTFAFTVPREGN